MIARKTSQEPYPGRVEELAAGAGWTRQWESDLWFPLEEPLPELPGSAVPSDVSLELIHVLHGYIAVAVMAGGKQLELVWDDLHDGLELLVRFVQVLAAGGEPHAYLADSMRSLVVVQNGTAPELCRFCVRADGTARGSGRDSVDVLTDRNGLLQEFRSLCRRLADHPNLSHQFVNHVALPDAEYDAVVAAAEAEWRKGVEEGTYPDDYDAEDAFVVSRIVAEVPLSPECVQLTEKYRSMLRTLEIPEGWSGSHAVFAA